MLMENFFIFLFFFDMTVQLDGQYDLMHDVT